VQEAFDSDITQLLHAWRGGDRAALDAMMPSLCAALRHIAASRLGSEAHVTTSTPTGLVHEALLRLLGADVDFNSRAHFLGLAALHMRSILVDRARARVVAEPARGALHVPAGAVGGKAAGDSALDLLALDRALDQLRGQDEQSARVMEMNCFAGMQRDEIAAAVGISLPSVDRDLRFARAWLNRALA
jgi:RNA polymerase sigma factor (TIGR02999 family)